MRRLCLRSPFPWDTPLLRARDHWGVCCPEATPKLLCHPAMFPGQGSLPLAFGGAFTENDSGTHQLLLVAR